MVAALFIVIAGGNVGELIDAKLALGKVTVIAWKILQWPVALSFYHPGVRADLLLRSRP